ncbi:conserved hypothetical protein [Leishmania braziliensis MHOM/BR/75/M2904]|uniref:Uncharacterized protein n=3 Tax=Viannia TaxID=37616 RepID=A4HP98_LEIBR|nr:conserved hypothetical protein [Leishmania braziliensis MHOM/BR/75/M2904]KAI5691300.1 hypothetical protein MNV84_08009 [Leishmania braziliensis]CAJ2481436.1 unnamed protein product [Leishmania braziliensis]CAJ2481833.1 unnamed protein product [Leishmania braziliensis]CAM44005.1 conserved hypothetical protein [Leishmania braziliensis MHOM/BR/75/M2904]
MKEAASATVAASPAPAYESVFVFLSTLAEWLKHARERLTCRDEVGRHATVVEVLTHHHERAYGRLAEFVWRHAAVISDVGTSLFPSAAVELTACVLLRLLLLLLAWWMLLRLVRTTTAPRLRARQIAVHPHMHQPKCIGNAQAVEAFIRPDAAQRGINTTLLWTVSACGLVACVLILGLLTMHIWMDVVLWRLLERWFSPLWQAQAWVSSRALWTSNDSWQGSLRAAAAPIIKHYTSSFFGVASECHLHLLSSFAWLRRVTQQVKMVYLWGVIGGTVLGVALWLLSYASRLLRNYNESLPYFEENDPLLCWLAQQEAEATQQRNNAALVALLESQRRQERVMERLTSSLTPAVQEQQQSLSVAKKRESPQRLEDNATNAATANDTKSGRPLFDDETAAAKTSAVTIATDGSDDCSAGKSREGSGPLSSNVLTAAFEEAVAAASATRTKGTTGTSCQTAPQSEEAEAATAATMSQTEREESPGV